MPSLSTGGSLASLGGGAAAITLSYETPLVFPPFPERTPASGFDASVNIPIANTGSDSRKTSTIFQVSKAGTISTVSIRVGSSFSTGSATDIRLETVGADGYPTGTLIALGANGSVTPAATNTLYTATLGTPAVVTQGQLIAVVITPSSTYNWAVSGTNWGLMGGLPYSANYSGSAWSLNTSAVALVRLNYSDASIMRVFGMSNFINQLTSVSVASSSTPNIVGAKFIAPFSGKVIGGYGYFNLNGAVDIELRSDNGVTLLTKSSLHANLPPSTAAQFTTFYFENEITIERGEVYYFVCKPTTTTAMIMYRTAPVTPVGEGSYLQYSSFAYTSATSPTNAASYTDSPISYPIMGLFFSQQQVV